MSRLTPVSWGDLVKRLRELGFEGPYTGGRHPQMRRGDITVIIQIHMKAISVSAYYNACCDKQAFLATSGWESEKKLRGQSIRTSNFMIFKHIYRPNAVAPTVFILF